MISEILNIVTVVIVGLHFILDIYKERHAKNLDEQRLQIEQGKAGLEMISSIPELIKTFFGTSIDDPEELKKKISQFKEKYKDFSLD